MNDAIYLKQGERLVEMTEQPYEYERVLQERLATHPRLLAGGQMSEEGIDRWALIGREKSVPDKEGGSERWSADHLFVDQNGVPTIVEVKRSENTEIRRRVVGQMLDYVAHASIYWDAETLSERFIETCDERGLDPEEMLSEVVGDGSVDDFWDTVEKNLRSKKIRLVFVADDVPSELKRVVEFLNEAMQDVEVLAIEVVQYTSDEESVFVPRLHGQTEEAKASTSSSTTRSGSEYVQTEAELYEDLEQKVANGAITREVADSFEHLYEFSKELGDEVSIGGAKNANFGLRVAAHQGDHSGRPSVFTANVSGHLKVWTAKMPLDNDNPAASPVPWDPKAYDDYEAAFGSLDGVPEGEPKAPFEVVTRGDNLEQFQHIVTEFVEHCREAADRQ
ncbi:hypothetical protein [Halomarina rubra]|uniref:DUF91 domain-containing protein n=1 Tax=Halomarina rubra TaxID=2071873 RepID=A0ABD6AUM5_9EURY|nr:hypothetical protein [Halomarina rubra]